jgi:flagellar motor switch protein FliG
MKYSYSGMRKAAILVGSLTPQEADRLLDHFTPDEVQRLRQLMVDLGPVDTAEEERVLEDFFQRTPLVPEQQPAGLDLSASGLRRAAALEQAETELGPTLHPFLFLHDAEADKLARALANERPQTIALVLSHLPPEQAGAVLVRLEAGAQVEVLRRLVDLEETAPEILREVERALESRLAEQVHMQRRRVAGLRAVAGILQASPRAVGSQIIRNLAHRDPALAEKFAPPPITFEDLQAADPHTWAQIVGAADMELLAVALLGAAPALIERVLRHMNVLEAEQLRLRLEHPGPTRLRDVEEARRQVAEIARRLAFDRRIDLHHTAPLMAGAA